MGVSGRRVLLTAAFVLSLASLARASCTPAPETGGENVRIRVCLEGDKAVGLSMKTEWTHGWVWVEPDVLASQGFTLTATGLANQFGGPTFEPIRPTGPSFAAADAEFAYIVSRARQYRRQDPSSGCADAYRYGQELVNFFRTSVPLTVCLSAEGVPTGVSFADGDAWGWVDARIMADYGWQLTEAGLVSAGADGTITIRHFSTIAKRFRAGDGNLTIQAIVRDEAAKRRAREQAQAAAGSSPF